MHSLIVGNGGIGRAVAELALEKGHRTTVLTRQGPGTTVPGAETFTVSDWNWDTVADALSDLPALPDRLIVATGLLWDAEVQPEKRSEEMTEFSLTASFAANTLLPAAVLGTLSTRLQRHDSVRVLIVTAKVGSIGDNRLGGWYAYRASKAATHMLIKTTAIEWQRRFPAVAIAAYHPGTTASPLSQPFQGRVPPDQLKTPAEAAHCLWSVLEDRIMPGQSGRFWNWDGSELPW